MNGRERVLRFAEWLIRRACRRLHEDVRDERYREWIAELPAVLDDPGVRFAFYRAVLALRFAAGQDRTTRQLGSTRKVSAEADGGAAAVDEFEDVVSAVVVSAVVVVATAAAVVSAVVVSAVVVATAAAVVSAIVSAIVAMVVEQRSRPFRNSGGSPYRDDE